MKKILLISIATAIVGVSLAFKRKNIRKKA